MVVINSITKTLNLLTFIILVIAILMIVGLFTEGYLKEFALSGVNVIQKIPTYIKDTSGIIFFIFGFIFISATLLVSYKKHTTISEVFKHFFEVENNIPVMKLAFSISQLSFIIFAVMNLLI